MEQKIKKICGIEYEEIYQHPIMIWKLYIKYAFNLDNKLNFGINESLLERAVERGVDHFIIKTKYDETTMNVPSKDALKEKRKNKEYKDIRIYNFKL